MAMETKLDRVRSEIEGKLKPPVEVMIGPSLVVSKAGLNRLSDSPLFEAQTQATLGHTFAQPRIEGLFTPATFQKMLIERNRTDPQSTATWNFYRGQAKASNPATIADIFDSRSVQSFNDSSKTGLQWDAGLGDSQRTDRLTATLEEIHGFLTEGGILLSRTSSALDALRDAGVASIDLGRAELDNEVLDSLNDIGYENPASFCAFGIASSTKLASSLVGNLLTSHSDVLLYRLGG